MKDWQDPEAQEKTRPDVGATLGQVSRFAQKGCVKAQAEP